MPTDAIRHFDPAGEVPEEYDITCNSCGYSLISLSTNRCPECGETFDPTALSFARIPWLHRKRLGRFNAYLQTVAMVCFLPGRFARELCRPVQICSSDARGFRRVTLWLSTVAFSLAVIDIVAVSISRRCVEERFCLTLHSRMLLALYGTMLLIMLAFRIPEAGNRHARFHLERSSIVGRR